MSNKIVLPKEVAAAIECVWNRQEVKGSIKHLALTNWEFLTRSYDMQAWKMRDYCEKHPIEYMRALVEGYEVEKTPEDIIFEYYRQQAAKDCMRQDQTTFAIRKVLDLLGIKIEGVNK